MAAEPSGRVALVTAADSAYFSLLRGLMASVRDNVPEGAVSLCVIDIGLDGEERRFVEERADHVVDGRWDVDFPDRVHAPRRLQGLTCRPFLPEYFGGYEVYLWVDADAWVQDADAIELLRRAAAGGSLGIVPEVDRAYSTHFDAGLSRRWAHQRYSAAFGREAADALWWNPVLNAGVYSLRGDSPGWGAWADLMARGLRTTQDSVDQTALNVLVYAGELSAHFLPATTNWLCHWALPAVSPEADRLLHPMLPHETLGIVHLAGPRPRASTVELAATDGSSVSRWLTYRGEPR